MRPNSLSMWLSVALFPVLLVIAVAGVDHTISRPDRIRHTRRLDDLLAVHDALLQHEFESGTLPARLEDLVPHHLRANQVAEDGVPLYAYDPQQRVVHLARGTTIRGVWRREWPPREMSLPVPPTLPLARGTPTAVGSVPALFAPQGPPGQDPPAGALVLEAELYSETNYAWEVHPDDTCGGGAVLHIKEGIANGPGQISQRIFNFFDVQEGTEYTFVKIRFHLDKPGRYFIYGRMWTTGSHCSNNLNVGLDTGGPRPAGSEVQYYGWGMGNRTPFRWVWTQVDGGPIDIPAGDHYLHIFPHEDGIRLDQFILSPVPVEGDAVYRANLVPNAGTAFAAASGPVADLTFDLKSRVMTPGMPPECNLAIRRLRPTTGTGTVRVVMKDAGPNGASLPLATHRVDLAQLPDLCFLPLDFTRIDWPQLVRREYLLTAELLQANAVVACTVPLLYPFAWEVSGSFPYLMNGQTGPLDGDRQPTDNMRPAWVPFADANWDAWGVLDFGLQTSGNSLYAPENVTIYAQTRISVPETNTYLLKLQSDDQMLLWLDGKLICQHDEQAPVTRSAAREPVRIEKGEHRLRMRVNNRTFSQYGDGRWQASLRIRIQGDQLSRVTGLPPPPPTSPTDNAQPTTGN